MRNHASVIRIGRACLGIRAARRLRKRFSAARARKHHIQHGERASTNGDGSAQQALRLVGLQIAPIDHRPQPTQQPARHIRVDPLALIKQALVAEQPIKGLEWCLDARWAPGQARATSVRVNRCAAISASTERNSTTSQRVHRLQ